MKHSSWQVAALALAAALPLASAQAQLEGLLGKGERGGDLKGMAGIAGAPLAAGSMGNVAGLLQYCIGNNYLGGQGAASLRDQLVGKLPGGRQTQDPGYSDGAKGLLHASNGNLMDLGGAGAGGVKAQLAKKACDTILNQARSFL
jgi:hypothetical protein